MKTANGESLSPHGYGNTVLRFIATIERGNMETTIYAIYYNNVIVYVGQTKNLNRRRKEHFKAIENKEYVLNNGIVLESNSCSIEAIDVCDYKYRLKLEEYYILKFNTLRYGLNYCLGQTRPQSKEEKIKRSNALKGRKFSEEHKRKLSESRKPGIYSEEGKKKLSIAQKKRWTKEEREKQSIAVKNRIKNNPEHAKLISKGLKKYYENTTEEQRAKNGSGSRKLFVSMNESGEELKVYTNKEALELASKNNHKSIKPLDYAIKSNKMLYGFYWKKVLEKEYYKNK